MIPLNRTALWAVRSRKKYRGMLLQIQTITKQEAEDPYCQHVFWLRNALKSYNTTEGLNHSSYICRLHHQGGLNLLFLNSSGSLNENRAKRSERNRSLCSSVRFLPSLTKEVCIATRETPKLLECKDKAGSFDACTVFHKPPNQFF